MSHHALHTLHNSPFTHNALKQCLTFALPGSAIILLNDAVLAAVSCDLTRQLLQQASQQHPIFALAEDYQMRGLDQLQLLANIKLIDYEQFVQLTIDYYPQHRWS